MEKMSLKEGSWWLNSKEDERWNCQGRCCVGSFTIPSGCKDKLEELRKKYGKEPEDLKFGYMKD